jgi:pyridoxamine 5'-phosphate oxidase
MPSLSERLFDDTDTAPIEPFALFEEWFATARDHEPSDPHAMAVATVDASGLPDVRMVLMNARDQRGFVFFTNFGSAKGHELLDHPKAAMVMHWKSLRRQVRARGPVQVVAPEEADAYFMTRSRGSQIASSASEQSRPLDRRTTLDARVASLTRSLGDGPVPRPPHWSGFRIIPLQLEFWQDGPFRLHDRIQFSRAAPEQPWARQRLYP